MIVFHSLRLLCVRSVDVMTSSHLLFFSSIILSTSLVPYCVARWIAIEYCFLYALYGLCYSSDGPEMYCSLHPSNIMCILGDECVSLSICVIQTIENVQEFSFNSVLMPALNHECSLFVNSPRCVIRAYIIA